MGKKENRKAEKKSLINLQEGMEIIDRHSLFGRLDGWICPVKKDVLGKQTASVVTAGGRIYVNEDLLLSPEEWVYIIAHQRLHLAFGHFDAAKMPYGEEAGPSGKVDIRLWNMACDLYIMGFLNDLKVGRCPVRIPEYGRTGGDEVKIYQRLLYPGDMQEERYAADALMELIHMKGLESPIQDWENGRNPYSHTFSRALNAAVLSVVEEAGEPEKTGSCSAQTRMAVEWFLSHYPLLGGLAAGFSVIEDYQVCQKLEIQVAAVDVGKAVIYLNPAAPLEQEERKFVLAHEYLHAGLRHDSRGRGRDPLLWNIACDFVINGWLKEMQVGVMPVSALYAKEYEGLSAESIYDSLFMDIRSAMKQITFRGYGKGDVMTGTDGNLLPGAGGRKALSPGLDVWLREALAQGLDWQIKQNGRGYLPLGLVEEIRALSMPPIPWDVKLAEWFEEHFPPIQVHHSYARPSRRQSSTPDIPRPGKVIREEDQWTATFGVVLDTSGSMEKKLLGKALGSIAGYAQAREVSWVRVVFCDAQAYDAGYLAPGEIAGRVEVTGRGGTVLQPAIRFLEEAKDFPPDAPILIITDGRIEDHLWIHREHAFLMPQGSRLPFRTKGQIFYFE